MRQTLVRDLRGYVGLVEAARITGVTSVTLRVQADTGKIRSVRDPVGRRLLWLEDVRAYAQRRAEKAASIQTLDNAGVS